MNGSFEIRGQLVISSCDSSEIFEPAKGIFDKVSFSVSLFAESERLFSVSLVWDDGFCTSFLQNTA
jgi:hypothetical protein